MNPKPPQLIQQLEQTPSIPPLSQSRFEDMACGLLYQARHVHGMKSESEAARRGSEIHKIIAMYMDHLGATKQQSDYDKLAELKMDASPEAKEGMEGFGESWIMDPEKFYDTEIWVAIWSDGSVHTGKTKRTIDSIRAAAVKNDLYVKLEGTLDMVLMDSPNEASIYDYKSYFQIIDADTFQSKLYPYLLFQLNPNLQRVRFVLAFVRYGDAMREVTYERADLPKLAALIDRASARQADLHATPSEKLKPSPGRHCTWCPLLLNGCPMRTMNPYENLSPSDRVGLAIWMSAAKKENDAKLKDWVFEKGEVFHEDANGNRYSAQFVESIRTSYPLNATYDKLMDWGEKNEADAKYLLSALNVSGLSSPIKAKKRYELAQQLVQISVKKATTKLKITAADEEDEIEAA